MIDLVLFVTFTSMAFRIAITVHRESDIFTEFNQPQTIGWLVWLFPLGPVIYYSLAFRIGWLPSVLLMLACYLPAFFSARKCIRRFDTAGTDRVDIAKEAVIQTYGTSIAGLIYTAVISVINIARYKYG